MPEDFNEFVEIENQVKTPLDGNLLRPITLQALTKKSDYTITALWSELQASQEGFHTSHGKYFQLLDAADDIEVKDGHDRNFSKRPAPHEQNAVDFTFSGKIPFNTEVHEWYNPDIGRGYQLICTFAMTGGEKYQRIIDSHTGDTGWYPYQPTPIVTS